MGVDNLATVTFNRPGFYPFAVSSRELRSLNQYYNKRKAALQSRLPQGRHNSRQIDRMGDKRYWRIQDIFHKAARRIVERLVHAKAATLVIGKNDGWKQEVNLGKRTNQTFVFIPHARFIEILTHKAEQVGIRVVHQEEAYTSKTSFLDLEPIEKRAAYLGKRIKRGLFRAANGQLINADCNGSYNIIRKFNPNAFSKPVVRSRKETAGYVVHPSRLSVKILNSSKPNLKPGLSHLS
jgi:putative transposase